MLHNRSRNKKLTIILPSQYVYMHVTVEKHLLPPSSNKDLPRDHLGAIPT